MIAVYFHKLPSKASPFALLDHEEIKHPLDCERQESSIDLIHDSYLKKKLLMCPPSRESSPPLLSC